jgi:NADH-ubiquinone oxidoreductase chain 2
LSCILFLLLLLSAHDFFILLFLIVALSLALYGLMLINYPLFSTTPETGAKYFLLSVISVGFMFGGIKELYLFCGHLNFSIVHNAIFEKIVNCTNYNELFSIKLAFFLFLFGFFFKIAAAPNHFWAPEVYAGLPYALLLFFVVPIKFIFCLTFFKIVKNVFFIFLLNDNLNYILFNEIEFFLFFVITLSMFIGGINAIFEQNLRKFIAYSSINQMGFLLIGFLGLNSNLFCFESFLYFTSIYFMNLAFFLTFFVEYSHSFFVPQNLCVFLAKKKSLHQAYSVKIINQIFGLSKEKRIVNEPNFFFFEYIYFFWAKLYTVKLTFLKDLKKIYLMRFFETKKKVNVLGFIAFVLSIFSLAGIPPFPGFYSKMYILLYALQAEHCIIFIVGILSSVLSIFYYLRLIKIMFFEKHNFQFYAHKIFSDLTFKNNFLFSFLEYLGNAVTFFKKKEAIKNVFFLNKDPVTVIIYTLFFKLFKNLNARFFTYFIQLFEYTTFVF